MRYLFLLFVLATFSSCKENDKNPKLFGQWQGTEWKIDGQASDRDASGVGFEFKEDETYTAQYGNQTQSGKWRTEKDRLFTTETGKKEIIVKLLQADGETLSFEMNRGGQKEVLTLKKK
jgi:hypothetical protein